MCSASVIHQVLCLHCNHRGSVTYSPDDNLDDDKPVDLFGRPVGTWTGFKVVLDPASHLYKATCERCGSVRKTRWIEGLERPTLVNKLAEEACVVVVNAEER